MKSGMVIATLVCLSRHNAAPRAAVTFTISPFVRTSTWPRTTGFNAATNPSDTGHEPTQQERSTYH